MPRKSRGPYLKWNGKRACWYVHINERGGRRELSTGTADSAEAEAFLGEIIAERRHAARTGPPDRREVLISDVLNDYLEDCAADQAQPNVVAGRVLKLLGFFEGKRVSEITPPAIKDYGRHSKVKPGTLRRELGILRAALNHAVRAERLKDAPFIALPEPPPGKDRWLTRNEAARLLWHARAARSDTRPYLTLYIRLALYTGARPGALRELRWPQVKFDQGDFGVIDFNPPGRSATNKGRPKLPMNAKIRAMMERAKAQHGSDLGPVFNRRGAAIGDLGNSFDAALDRAGIKGVTPHTLRHTVGTWLAQRRTPIFEIGGWMGHSDSRTTARYMHHHPDYLGGARQAMTRR